MNFTRRTVGLFLIGAGTLLVAGPSVARLFAHPAEVREGQEQAPNRREFTVTAKDFRFSPQRLEVTQDDLVRLTVRSEDVAYSLTIDEYRVSKRVPAGGSTTFEFRADRPGTFPFYSNLTSDTRHGQTRGELVVRGR
jgi:heme/copper-type cytochrome/quinol oxidase subunit 2